MLALRVLRGARRIPAAAVFHGAAGAAGLILLILSLRNGTDHPAMGVAGFGPAAAVLFGLALICGIATRFVPRRATGFVLAVHAGLAITGFVIFLAWSSIGWAAP